MTTGELNCMIITNHNHNIRHKINICHDSWPIVLIFNALNESMYLKNERSWIFQLALNYYMYPNIGRLTTYITITRLGNMQLGKIYHCIVFAIMNFVSH